MAPAAAATISKAAPFAVGFLGAAQYSAQGSIGKFNQSVNERNARVLEGQADQIKQKAEFDVAQFNKKFNQIEGTTKVALAKSGVEMGSGSAYNIELSNAFEAELQRQLIEYNFYAEDIHAAYDEARKFTANQDVEYTLKYLIRVWS